MTPNGRSDVAPANCNIVRNVTLPLISKGVIGSRQNSLAGGGHAGLKGISTSSYARGRRTRVAAT